jgi:hypothetical protein
VKVRVFLLNKTLKGVDMRTLIYSLVFMSIGSVCFAGNCSNGSCTKPIRTATKSTLSFVGNIITVPTRAVRNTRARIRSNRTVRTNCNCQ